MNGVTEEGADDEEDEEEDENVAANKKIVSFEVNQEKLESLQQRTMAMDYPLLAEYDFRNDHENPELPIALYPETKIRDYQAVVERRDDDVTSKSHD